MNVFKNVQWDEYFDQVKPLMLRLPYMVNPGNHESDSNHSKYVLVSAHSSFKFVSVGVQKLVQTIYVCTHCI